jgi:hypothetical protein
VVFLLSWLAPNHPPVPDFTARQYVLALISFFAGSLTAQKISPIYYFFFFIQVFFANPDWPDLGAMGKWIDHPSGDALVSNLFLTGVGFAWWLRSANRVCFDEGERMPFWQPSRLSLHACRAV